MAQTTLLDGRTVDYVVRRERGTINRFIYSFAMLAPFGEQPGDQPDTSLWNKRAIFTFDGGVRSATARARPAAARCYDHGLQQGLRDHALVAARARARTTTSCSAARRR